MTYQNAKDYILSVFMLFSSGLQYVNLMFTSFLCLVPFVATKKKLMASVLNSKLNLDFFVHIRITLHGDEGSS